jgi:hypothetical protein
MNPGRGVAIEARALLRIQLASQEDGLCCLFVLFPFRCMAFAAKVFPAGFGRNQCKGQIILGAFRAKGKLFDVFQNFLFVG